MWKIGDDNEKNNHLLLSIRNRFGQGSSRFIFFQIFFRGGNNLYAIQFGYAQGFRLQTVVLDHPSRLWGLRLLAVAGTALQKRLSSA